MDQLINKLDLSSIKFSPQILLCMIGVWVILIACVILSILSRPFSDKERRFWMFLTVCVPVIGVLAYLPFSFRHDELPPFLMPRRKEKRRRRRTSRPLIEAPQDNAR